MTSERELACTVLWLRNHLNVGSPFTKRQVIITADRILKKHGDVTPKEYGEFVTTTLKELRDDN